jgi:hypothetical protein
MQFRNILSKKEAMKKDKFGPEKPMYKIIQKAGDTSTLLR